MEAKLFSVVVVVNNIAETGIDPLNKALAILERLGKSHELIVIDNASDDGSAELLKSALRSGEMDNTILLRLAKKADLDSALWVGIQNSLGDYVITLPGSEDGLGALEKVVNASDQDLDVVIAVNSSPSAGSLAYRLARWGVGRIGNAGMAALSRCVLMSRRLVSFLEKHSQPQTTFRQLTQLPGLNTKVVEYRDTPIYPEGKTLKARYASGMQYLMWRNPRLLRGASLLALIGAVLNVAYAAYVAGVFLFGTNIEPGWASSSLQFSGMFFLFSLALFVLSENVLLSISLAGRDPVAFIAEERASLRFGPLDASNIRVLDQSQVDHSPPQNP